MELGKKHSPFRGDCTGLGLEGPGILGISDVQYFPSNNICRNSFWLEISLFFFFLHTLMLMFSIFRVASSSLFNPSLLTSGRVLRWQIKTLLEYKSFASKCAHDFSDFSCGTMFLHYTQQLTHDHGHGSIQPSVFMVVPSDGWRAKLNPIFLCPITWRTHIVQCIWTPGTFFLF